MKESREGHEEKNDGHGTQCGGSTVETHARNPGPSGGAGNALALETCVELRL